MSDIYSSITKHFTDSPDFDGVEIYYKILPEGVVTPCIRFDLISSVYIGVSHDGASLKRSRIQFDGVHPLVANAAQLRYKIYQELNNFSGVMGEGLTIQSCLPLGVALDNYDDKLAVYLAQQDWTFEYQEEGE